MNSFPGKLAAYCGLFLVLFITQAYLLPLNKSDSTEVGNNVNDMTLFSNETALVDTLNNPMISGNSTELARVKRQGGGCGCCGCGGGCGCGCCCCRP